MGDSKYPEMREPPFIKEALTNTKRDEFPGNKEDEPEITSFLSKKQ